jgi:hypothetical protein
MTDSINTALTQTDHFIDADGWEVSEVIVMEDQSEQREAVPQLPLFQKAFPVSTYTPLTDEADLDGLSSREISIISGTEEVPKDNRILAAKIGFTVILVLLLLTAAAATWYVSLPLLAATGLSYLAGLAVGLISVGFMTAALFTPFIGMQTHTFEVTDHNVKDCRTNLMSSLYMVLVPTVVLIALATSPIWAPFYDWKSISSDDD